LEAITRSFIGFVPKAVVAPWKELLRLKGKLWHDKQTGQPIQKDDVGHMMEQASSASDDIPDLVFAAAGRITTAMSYGVANFDDLDRGHMEMLAIDLMTILFRRSDTLAR
jgi:hypothetical protein